MPDTGEQPQMAPDPAAADTDLALDFGLRDVVEALLFVSDRPLAPSRIAEVLDEDVDRVAATLEELRGDYQQGGLRILEHDGRFQMATAPDAAPFCRALLGLEPNQRLTQASLETLAIVAYRQPVEEVRGVNSDSPLSRLLAYGLVSAIGRSSRVGRPMLYGTTAGFLAYFGVDSLSNLPELDLPDFSAPSPDYVEPELDAATAEPVDEDDSVDQAEPRDQAESTDVHESPSDGEPYDSKEAPTQGGPFDQATSPEPAEGPETSA